MLISRFIQAQHGRRSQLPFMRNGSRASAPHLDPMHRRHRRDHRIRCCRFDAVMKRPRNRSGSTFHYQYRAGANDAESRLRAVTGGATKPRSRDAVLSNGVDPIGPPHRPADVKLIASGSKLPASTAFARYTSLSRTTASHRCVGRDRQDTNPTTVAPIVFFRRSS